MNRMPTLTAAMLGLAALTACLPAKAQPEASAATRTDSPALSVSGFGTLGLVRTNRSDADFVVPGQPEGASRTASAAPDSKLGLQFTAHLGESISANAQLLGKNYGDGRWRPGAEWLFGKVQIQPGLSMRIGRIGAPFFAVSDFREVNYANTWIRPPLDVYGQVPISHLDGADVTARVDLGQYTMSAQAFAGSTDARWRGDQVRLQESRGLNVTVDIAGDWTLRLGHATTLLTVDVQGLSGLLEGLRQASFMDVATMVDAKRRRASFSGIGLAYDDGRAVAVAEYTRRRTTTAVVPDTTGWYGSLGWRFNHFTPYVIVSRQSVDNPNVVNSVPSGIDPGLTTLANAVDGLVVASNTAQRTQALGVRWDVARNVAAKSQFERIVTGKGAGQFMPTSSGFGGGARVDVVSLSVDFVF